MTQTLQPTFIWQHFLIRAGLSALPATLLFGYPLFVFIGLVFLPVLFITLVLFVSYLMHLSYRRTRFILESDRVIYTNDFITTTVHEIKYKNIKEIILHQGVLQKYFGLGTVELLTHATASPNQSSGLKVYNVKDPFKVHALLKEHMDTVE
jgi:uncharacterized membrane protein YdbT with pleckstrin-like domain